MIALAAVLLSQSPDTVNTHKSNFNIVVGLIYVFAHSLLLFARFARFVMFGLTVLLFVEYR